MVSAEEWEEVEQRGSEQIAQLKNQVSSLTDALNKLSTGAKANSDDAICQTEGCERPIDWYCGFCKNFICTRCSKKACGEETNHKAEDFEKVYEACKSKYEEYVKGRDTTISDLTIQKDKLEKELASDIQKMVGLKPEQLANPEVMKLTTDVSTKQRLLQDLVKQVEEANSLQSMDVALLSQQDFIKVFEELNLGSNVFEITKLERITLSEKCEVLMKRKCINLDVTPSGEILISRSDGFDICDQKGEVRRSINVKGFTISTAQYFKNKIYTLAKEVANGNKKRKVMVFDIPNYTESKRWNLPDYEYISMLAVGNDKVYVVDGAAKKVLIYSLTGNALGEFYHSEFRGPIYMSSCPPDGVLVSDFQTGYVYKIDCANDQIAWRFKVGDPRGVLCDSHGNIWVWDRKSKELILRSSDGGQTKNFAHKELVATGVDFITGFAMADGKLWIAGYDKGAMSIKVNIAPA